MTENAIKDILFCNDDYEYNDGKIKFKGILSGGSTCFQIQADLSKMKRSEIYRRLYELHKEECEAYEYLCGVDVKLTSNLGNIMRILKKNKLTNLVIDKFDPEGAKEVKDTRNNMTKDALKTLNFVYNISTKDSTYMTIMLAQCLEILIHLNYIIIKSTVLLQKFQKIN